MVILRTLFWLFLALCISAPGPAAAVTEEGLAARYEEEISPFFSQTFAKGWFTGVDGSQLHYVGKKVAREKAVLVFVSGRTEYVAKYAEVFFDLKKYSFSLYSYDHRGQGSSGRLLEDAHKGHVDEFQDYVTDLSMFLGTIVFPQSHAPVFLITHSMGGAISYLYMVQNPGRIQGAVLCAPMFAIDTTPLPKVVAEIIASLMTSAGQSEKYIFGGKPYNPLKQFEKNDLTHSKVRFAINKRLVAASPQVALGSPTFGWLRQSFKAEKIIAETKHPAVPPLLILSGEEDRVVSTKIQKEVCAGLPDCRFKSLAGAKHELLMEKDPIRDVVLARIVKFVDGLLP